jgi:hypothetical protein
MIAACVPLVYRSGGRAERPRLLGLGRAPHPAHRLKALSRRGPCAPADGCAKAWCRRTRHCYAVDGWRGGRARVDKPACSGSFVPGKRRRASWLDLRCSPRNTQLLATHTPAAAHAPARRRPAASTPRDHTPPRGRTASGAHGRSVSSTESTVSQPPCGRGARRSTPSPAPAPPRPPDGIRRA